MKLTQKNTVGVGMKKHTNIIGATIGTMLISMIAAGSVLQNAAAQAPRLMSPSIAAEGQISFADLVEKVSPAVVSVHTEKSVERPSVSMFEERFGFRAPPGFEERFGDRFENEQERDMPRARAEGSGFFIDNAGHIVTNNHVIADADKITVKLNDGRELDAELIGTDEGTDLAVLKVAAGKDQAFVEFSDSVDLRVGDWVLAVGNPFGLGGTVTSGIVSALGRDNYATGAYNDFIQIDAPINRGNSGGPTFDLLGRVVGVNTAIYSPTGGSVGIGFAIPSDVAGNIVRQLIAKGTVSRGWLGVEIRDIDPNIAAALELEEAKGALVANVTKGSPAGKAGFQSGDVVYAFNGSDVDSSRGLTRAVGAVEPGKVVEAKILRNGKKQNIKVELGERTEANLRGELVSEKKSTPESATDLGVRFSALDGSVRQQYDVENDVNGIFITDVERDSAAAKAGLSEGMIVLKADGEVVTSPKDFKKKIDAAKAKKKEAMLLRVQKGNRKDFRALPLSED